MFKCFKMLFCKFLFYSSKTYISLIFTLFLSIIIFKKKIIFLMYFNLFQALFWNLSIKCDRNITIIILLSSTNFVWILLIWLSNKRSIGSVLEQEYSANAQLLFLKNSMIIHHLWYQVWIFTMGQLHTWSLCNSSLKKLILLNRVT